MAWDRNLTRINPVWDERDPPRAALELSSELATAANGTFHGSTARGVEGGTSWVRHQPSLTSSPVARTVRATYRDLIPDGSPLMLLKKYAANREAADVLDQERQQGAAASARLVPAAQSLNDRQHLPIAQADQQHRQDLKAAPARAVRDAAVQAGADVVLKRVNVVNPHSTAQLSTTSTSGSGNRGEQTTEPVPGAAVIPAVRALAQHGRGGEQHPPLSVPPPPSCPALANESEVLRPFLESLEQHQHAVASLGEPASASVDTLRQRVTQQVAHLLACVREELHKRERLEPHAPLTRCRPSMLLSELKPSEEHHVRHSRGKAAPGLQGAADEPGSGKAAPPVHIVFLPYILHPAQHALRWFAVLVASFRDRRTTWLAIAWACILLLAITLLIGLLVPWNKEGSHPGFVDAPQVLAGVSVDGINLQIRLDHTPVSVAYAVIPTALISQNRPSSRRRQLLQASTVIIDSQHRIAIRKLQDADVTLDEASGVLSWVQPSDVVEVASAQPGAVLLQFASACGILELRQGQGTYNVSISSALNTTNLECTTTLTGRRPSRAGIGSATPGACSRCAVVDNLDASVTVLLAARESGRLSTLQAVQLAWLPGVGWQ